MGKPKICIFFIISLSFFAIFSLNSFADERGTCTNPGAGTKICGENLVSRDNECCPNQQQNPSYYRSASNPTGPQNYNDCIANFFFKDTDASQVNDCKLGCCCTNLAKDVKIGAQCKGTGETFHLGDTDCSECTLPQCNDKIDNDNNQCKDLDDSGCSSPSDQTEAGGICLGRGQGCQSTSYTPRLSSLRAEPVKGERKIRLIWADECSQNAVSYEIRRCQGPNCQNFALIATSNTNSFTDSSNELLFDATYTYQIKSFYNLQTANPTATVLGQLGNFECWNMLDNSNFCIHAPYYPPYKDYLTANDNRFSQGNFESNVNSTFSARFNRAFSCSNNNVLQEQLQCSQNQVCVVTNNVPKCAEKSLCNYPDANPFGLYYQQTVCENNNYCFFDRSLTIANNCYQCSTAMSCYDYKSRGSCERDNCGASSCEWRPISDELGTGVCISTTKDNCKWCNKAGTDSVESSKAFSSVFEICTAEKAEKLSIEKSQCYFRDGSAKSCEDVTCLDYQASECGNSISHDEFNRIRNPSNDKCGIKTCQIFNSQCRKNADGNSEADCNNLLCEQDYYAPNTTIIPLIERGVYKNLAIQIFDKSGKNATATRRTSGDYKTYLCLEPCGQNGHPYEIFTNSYNLILTNSILFDGNNGSRVLTLNEGANTLRYYSQDPAKNIGQVKTVSVETHGNASGPAIFRINVTGAKKTDNKFYTNVLKPKITVEFFENASITHAAMKSQTGFITTPTYNAALSKKFEFVFSREFAEGAYVFELNAKNRNNIFMDKTELVEIILDNSTPVISITPAEGRVLNQSSVEIRIQSDKEISLEEVAITDRRNITNIVDIFRTDDNRIFTATAVLSDGNKEIMVKAGDYAGNGVIVRSKFIVNAKPLTITLLEPSFGISSNYTFDVVVATDNNALCKYSFNDDLQFGFMDAFDATNNATHKIKAFNKIPFGSKNEYPLNVKCNDTLYGLGSAVFKLRVDTEPPIIKEAFANPNPVVEIPMTTVLTINTDKPTICRYSLEKNKFDEMESNFPGFEEDSFRTVHKNNVTETSEGSFRYLAACQAQNKLVSGAKEIKFEVNTKLPLRITSHTPEYSNTPNIILAIETNKRSQCKFSAQDPKVEIGTIFGNPDYSHTRSLIANIGKNSYYVICKDQFSQKWSDVLKIDVTVDTTSPVMETVDDTSTLPNNPEFTYRTNQLRVKLLGRDNETRVFSYLYTLEEFGTLKSIFNWTASYIENDWFLVNDLNLSNGAKYFFRAKAKNIVGLLSDEKSSNGITIDVNLKPSNCSNRIKDQQETDIDCGGPCDQCSEGKICKENIDCKSEYCNARNVCAAPGCNDNAKNKDESDVDCGGSSCNKCIIGKACNVNRDCSSNYCGFGICKSAESCEDKKLSGTESDVDCGGACSNKCNEGQHCGNDNDCNQGSKCIESACKICEENDLNCNGVSDDRENDADGDGMPDDWEIQHGLDPNNPDDANIDSDNDGLTNKEEYTYRTNPNKTDTDDDSYSDKKEIDKDTDPLDPNSRPKSKLGFILLLVFLIILLIAGGYFAYTYYEKRGEREKIIPMPQKPIPSSSRPRIAREQLRQMQESLKKREEEKKEKREKLFEAFGGKKESQKTAPQAKKPETEKPKEADVFSELKTTTAKKPEAAEISRIQEQIRKLPSNEKEDVMEKLTGLAKKTRQGKIAKGDVFKELKMIIAASKKKKK